MSRCGPCSGSSRPWLSSDEPILLQGETGTGKELFARAIHKSSGGRGPFVATNLGGLEDLLVSDTLFGHVKGAYTGADEARKGTDLPSRGGDAIPG